MPADLLVPTPVRCAYPWLHTSRWPSRTACRMERRSDAFHIRWLMALKQKVMVASASRAAWIMRADSAGP